ncbi:MAG: zinc metallopeptidase [Chthoniobacterales bacterium]
MIGEWLLFFIIPALLGVWAQTRVSRAFRKYKQVGVSSNVTGAQAAAAILNAANIHDVSVVEINDMLGDHYDPAHKRLCLSSDVYRNSSVAAVGIAAHECGHAIQHAKAYAPLKLRMAVVPATMLVSQALPFILIAGFFVMGLWKVLLPLAIVGLLVMTLFQLITLPVEFDATRRAKALLPQMGIIQPGAETAGVNKVLDAAAWTYVAAFVSALSNLLYYILPRGRN